MTRYYKLINYEHMGATYKFLNAIGILEEEIYTCASYGESVKQRFFAIQRETYTPQIIKELLNNGFKKD